ncbi:unnamed protein product [Moneuplotes crassus]|uniref:Uncharacterized protein n=1 Tax=Euplotes crassus TaxID=5936 RepID=A0AAD1XBZ0_EUPCR|nr:unnamed protein product [Moneuplotes crassus]
MEKSIKDTSPRKFCLIKKYYIDFHIKQIRDWISADHFPEDLEFIKEICGNYIDIDKIKETVFKLKNIEDQCVRTNEARNKYFKLVRERDNVGINVVRNFSFGIIAVGKTKKEKLEDFDLEHGEEIEMLKKTFEEERAKTEDMIDNAILEEIEQEVKRNVDGFKEDKAAQRREELLKNIFRSTSPGRELGEGTGDIAERCYTVEIGRDKGRVNMVFGLVEGEEVEEVKERVFGRERGEEDGCLGGVIGDMCEEVCFVLGEKVQEEKEEFFKYSGFCHFIDLIKMCDLSNVETIILQNFYFKDEELNEILDTVICASTIMLEFKNCEFESSQEPNLVKEKQKNSCLLEKDSFVCKSFSTPNSTTQDEMPGNSYINKFLQQKLSSLKEEKDAKQKALRSPKRVPLYGLSFIECSVSSLDNQQCEELKNSDIYHNNENFASFLTRLPSFSKALMTFKINQILSKISSEGQAHAQYKGRGLVSLTLKDCYLPEPDYEFIKKKWSNLAIFIVSDSPL